MTVCIGDFCPFNRWVEDPDPKAPRYTSPGNKPLYVIDMTTGKGYLNDTPGCVRTKSLLLALGTPLIHPIASICNVVYRILKLVTFAHFWTTKKSFTAKLQEAGKDLLRIVLTPLALVGLELFALYGSLTPQYDPFLPSYDGKKLYATIERSIYTRPILAPCFQPYADSHFFGGDIKTRNAF